uniref:CD209 antigen-like protein E n=1 Tax=Acanthochromis polyacanthus TaxID=80966 RepID=A0A3Q1EE19_9TELE
MSVAMINKSEEAEGDTWNEIGTEERFKYGWRSQCPVWWIRAAAVCLGLLLLIVIFGLVAHNASAIGQQDSLLDHLMKCEKLIHNLTTDNYALRDELNQMKVNSSRLTKEMEELQREYKTVRRSALVNDEEYTTLNSSSACKVCQRGWIKFNNKCYYASEKGQAKNWEDSRKDCLKRGVDLVMPTTKEELDFVARIYEKTWIGLSDKKHEGTWLWVDGSRLVTGFWQTGEPNNAGDEDCAEFINGKWNDALCSLTVPWICED